VRTTVKDAKRIVIKIGTSSITYESGRLNLRKMETLARVLTDLQNSGKEIVLVSSGAIGAGMDRMGFKEYPKVIEEKQAAASVGQAILMELYQKFFLSYNQSIGQILLTADVFSSKIKKTNARNTFNTLLNYGVVPIVNENDPISTDEIQEERFGDNDTLSAMVALLVEADLLVILSDVEGLYDCNPCTNENAQLISYVDEITPELLDVAEGSNSKTGTGGMMTKLMASKITSKNGIHTILSSGNELEVLYAILEGQTVGTFIK